MQIVQSYVSSIFRGQLSKYEQRILIKMAEHGQVRVRGLALSHIHSQLEHQYGITRIELPIRYLLDESSNHYEHVWAAVQSLEKKVISIKDPQKNTWFSASLIMQAEHLIGKGVITFLVPKVFYDALFNFAMGFRSYDLETAMSFKLPSSSRLFIMMQGVRQPIKYPLPYLKEMFGVSDKYPRNSDFIKRIITPAVEEVKQCGQGTWFDVVPVKRGCTFTHLEFIPHQRATDAQRMAEPRAMKHLMSESVRQLLMDHAGFTLRELSHHRALLTSLGSAPMGEQIVIDIVARARKTRKGKGYIISALRDELGVK